jgi:hypothetical protein
VSRASLKAPDSAETWFMSERRSALGWRALACCVAAFWIAGCQSLPPPAASTPPVAAAPAASARSAGVEHVAATSRLELAFIGQQVLPQGYRYAGTTVGGLSGIDYDAATGRYWVISDDRSEFGASRFYEVALDLSHFNKTPDPGHAGVTFAGVHTLKRPDGSVFANHATDPANAADPESIRLYAPSGRLVWSSEGERSVGTGTPPVLVDPHVWEMERDGHFVRALPIPAKFRSSAGNHGIRHNLAFEGLAFTPDYGTLYVATENALLQDGPIASLSTQSPSRIIEYDYPNGAVRAEYVVDVSPIPVPPTKADGAADNGISEILAIDRGRLLLMERSYAFGVGNTIRLYDVDLTAATNVAALDALAGQSYVPAAKTLVLDLAALRIRLDNVEGMTWGPRLASGNRSLILVSDDNFNPRQITLFLAFEVRER